MAEEVNLSLFDRVVLKDLVIGKRDNIGGLDQLKIALDILEKADFSDEEIDEFGIKQDQQTIRWNKDQEVPVSFSKKEMAFVKNAIEEKKNWPLDIRNLLFGKKFGISIGDDSEE